MAVNSISDEAVDACGWNGNAEARHRGCWGVVVVCNQREVLSRGDLQAVGLAGSGRIGVDRRGGRADPWHGAEGHLRGGAAGSGVRRKVGSTRLHPVSLLLRRGRRISGYYGSPRWLLPNVYFRLCEFEVALEQLQDTAAATSVIGTEIEHYPAGAVPLRPDLGPIHPPLALAYAGDLASAEIADRDCVF